MNACSGCGQDFGSLSAFDRHQRWADGKLICLEPVLLGMHRDSRGRWRQAVVPFREMVSGWTDSGLASWEQRAVAGNQGGVYESTIQAIAAEINLREELRRGIGVQVHHHGER